MSFGSTPVLIALAIAFAVLIGLPGYAIVQWSALTLWRGAWRWLAGLPLAAVLVWSLACLEHAGTPMAAAWPVELAPLAIAGLVFLVLCWGLQRLTHRWHAF